MIKSFYFCENEFFIIQTNQFMGKCQICSSSTKKETAKFCSIKCKSISQKGKREELDPNKRIKCKLYGKEFKDYLNRSGALTEYSKAILNKEFDWNDWVIFDKIDTNKYWECPECDKKLRCETGQDSSGFIFKHLITHGYQTKLKVCQKYPEFEILWPNKIKKEKNKKFIDEHEDNRVQCLECGEWMRKISNTHLRSKHNGMDVETYKKKHLYAKLDSKATIDKLKKNYELHLGQMSFESNGQREIKEFVQSFGFSTKTTRQLINGEIDIYIEEKNIAIEFNGLYHHAVLQGRNDRNYHINKTTQCESKNVHLIQVFEDDWRDKKEIVKSRLKNILSIQLDKSIFARKCEIRTVKYKDAEMFINDNHLQGWGSGTSINYGLFYENELVSLMTFSHPRFRTITPDSYELVRFCNKINISITGGASKLFNAFISDYRPNVVYTYADRCWSPNFKENLYDKLGFTKIGVTEPNYWYMSKYIKRLNRNKFRPQILKRKYPEYAENWTDEKTVMTELGYDWIYDCGSIKYVYNFSSDEVIIHDDQIDNVNDNDYKNITRQQRPERTDEKRKTYFTNCKICGFEVAIVGIQSHVINKHGLSMSEYNAQYLHLSRKEEELQAKIAEVGDQFKCLECGALHTSQKHLSHHIGKEHGSMGEYVLKVHFGGITPTCKCGCGKPVRLKSTPPYKLDYCTGHNSRGENNGMFGKKHTHESKLKMSGPRTKRK